MSAVHTVLVATAGYTVGSIVAGATALMRGPIGPVGIGAVAGSNVGLATLMVLGLGLAITAIILTIKAFKGRKGTS